MFDVGCQKHVVFNECCDMFDFSSSTHNSGWATVAFSVCLTNCKNQTCQNKHSMKTPCFCQPTSTRKKQPMNTWFLSSAPIRNIVFIEFVVDVVDVGCQKQGVVIDCFTFVIFQFNMQFRLGYSGLFGVFVELEKTKMLETHQVDDNIMCLSTDIKHVKQLNENTMCSSSQILCVFI
jgi:hypothetical protein